MPSSDKWRWTKHMLVALSFAFVAGYVDVFSVTRWNVFVTMMSGNVIFMGRVMFGSDPFHGKPHKLIYYIVVIILFNAGSFLWNLVERRLPGRGASTLAYPFTGMMFVLEMAETFLPDNSVVARFPSINVLFYTPLFGVLSAACAQSRLGTTTTMATGHMLAVSSLLELRTQRAWTKQEGRKVRMGVGVIIFLVLGATVSTMLQMAEVRVQRAVLPIAPVLALLTYFHDHLVRPRSFAKKFKRRRGTPQGDESSPAKHDDESSPEESEDEHRFSDGEEEDDDASDSDNEYQEHDGEGDEETARATTTGARITTRRIKSADVLSSLMRGRTAPT